jgi:hypothetical protein
MFKGKNCRKTDTKPIWITSLVQVIDFYVDSEGTFHMNFDLMSFSTSPMKDRSHIGFIQIMKKQYQNSKNEKWLSI